MKTAITAGQWEAVPATQSGVVVGYGWVHYNYFHQFPNWMPLKLHLLIEKALMEIPRTIACNRVLGRLYSLIHGLICAYSIEEIKDFWFRNYHSSGGKANADT